jgi:RNA polymerase sigma factor (sigma-70 family)
MTTVVRHLRRLVLLRDGDDLTDGQLLEDFVTRNEEVAFEALVRRHGPMVLGVCRRVLRHHHDAEDAFQATFLVLVRKGESIMPRDHVGNWLYGVAYRTALKARTMGAQRRLKESQVRDIPETDVSDHDRLDWQPLLDRELSRLPNKYRTLLVCCDLEGKSRKQAARTFGLPEGTVSSRLARARRMLATRFKRLGVEFSAGLLATAISRQAASASVPPALLQNTVHAATLMTAGEAITAGIVSTNVIALMEGVLSAMLISKLKFAMVIVLVMGLIGFGASTSYQGVARADKPAPEAQPVARGAQKPKADVGPTIPATVTSIDGNKFTITVSVQKGKGTKETMEQTFELVQGAKVLVNDGKKKGDAGKEVALTHLKAGDHVYLQLSADQKKVREITVGPSSIYGQVKALDTASNILTVTFKSQQGLQEKTLSLASDTKVLLNDGLTKGTSDVEGKIADLTEGTSITVRVSALVQKTALDIRIQGIGVLGTLKGVDVGSNQITITVKEDGMLVDKTFTVAKNARMPGTLGDLSAGKLVNLRLSVFDKKSVVDINLLEK